ncbi:hypothetical protein CAter282_1236 [Collimonas arenae]|uniref:Uncharacterized protein n=2 Tax=Collimonas arenae TaxID=279058 RepID=A0A127QG35_9BURK|nr:hypothetical protein CAter282_1236 [Collimonas arenae]
MLPVLAACAAPEADNSTASANNQENIYATGSNLPTRQTKQNMKTLTPEQAVDMIPPTAPRGPKG